MTRARRILSTRTKVRKRTKKETGFMGTHFPKPVTNYTMLYCMANSTPKSTILRELLANWVEETQRELSIDTLEGLIAERAHWTWGQTTGTSFAGFLQSVRYELRHAKLADEAIERIIKLVEYAKDKDEEG